MFLSTVCYIWESQGPRSPGDLPKVIHLITLKPVFVSSSSDVRSSGLSLTLQRKGEKKAHGVLSPWKFYYHMTSNMWKKQTRQAHITLLPSSNQTLPRHQGFHSQWKSFPGTGVWIPHENRGPSPILRCVQSTGFFPSLLGQEEVPLEHFLGKRNFKL